MDKQNMNKSLDKYGIIVDQLVKSADSFLHLSDAEKSIIVGCAFNGINKVLDKR